MALAKPAYEDAYHHVGHNELVSDPVFWKVLVGHQASELMFEAYKAVPQL